MGAKHRNQQGHSPGAGTASQGSMEKGYSPGALTMLRSWECRTTFCHGTYHDFYDLSTGLGVGH